MLQQNRRWAGSELANENKSKMKLQERDNRGHNVMYNNLLNQGHILLNSSYTQAADPNSMRDFGPARNTIYNFIPNTD